MKLKASSFFTGTGAAAMILLAACQQSESPTQSKPSDTGAPTLEQGLMATDGRKATPEEIATGLEAFKDSPALEQQAGQAPLAKSAALATCIVDFNNVAALAAMPSQANQGTAMSPWYKHPCNASYTVFVQPVNTQYYKVVPENPQACAGPAPLIGYKSGAYCVGHTEGKYWPRTVGNLGGNTGVRFFVKTNAGASKNFNIEAMTMISGNAQVTADRVGIGGWIWYPFNTPTRYYWPAGTAVKWIEVASNGLNGYIRFDKVEISIIP